MGENSFLRFIINSMSKSKHIGIEILLHICGVWNCDIEDVIKLIKEDKILE